MTFEKILESLIPSQRENALETVLAKEAKHKWFKKEKFIKEANQIRKENAYRYEPNSTINITLGLLTLYQESDGNLEETESILLAELISSFDYEESSSIIQTWNDPELLSLLFEKFHRSKAKTSQCLFFLERELQATRKEIPWKGKELQQHLKNALETVNETSLENWSNQQLERDVIETLDRQLMGGK